MDPTKIRGMIVAADLSKRTVATSTTNLAAWLKFLGRFGIDLTLQLPFRL